MVECYVLPGWMAQGFFVGSRTTQPNSRCRQKPASQGTCPRQPGNCVSLLAAQAFAVDGRNSKTHRTARKGDFKVVKAGFIFTAQIA